MRLLVSLFDQIKLYPQGISLDHYAFFREDCKPVLLRTVCRPVWSAGPVGVSCFREGTPISIDGLGHGFIGCREILSIAGRYGIEDVGNFGSVRSSLPLLPHRLGNIREPVLIDSMPLSSELTRQESRGLRHPAVSGDPNSNFVNVIGVVWIVQFAGVVRIPPKRRPQLGHCLFLRIGQVSAIGANNDRDFRLRAGWMTLRRF